MANIQYNINPITSGSLYPDTLLDNKQEKLVNQFEINNVYAANKHYIRLEYKSLDGTTVEVNPNLVEYSLLQNAQSAGRVGSSVVTLDPIANIKSGGFEGSDIILKYQFLNNPLSTQKFGGDFFIKQISPDRREVKLLSTQLNDSELQELGNTFINELNSKKAFAEFYIVSQDIFLQCLNIKLGGKEDGQEVIIKLSKKLPDSFQVNTAVAIAEDISEPLVFECKAEVLPEVKKLNKLKGPNFSLEIADQASNTTEFFNYNELFSYPVTGSYYELHSLFNEESAQISIDHTDFNDFIHFSSAEERLRNFKYKLDLVHSYEDSLYTASLSGRDLQGISGSADYYNGLITGIIKNFDHYDNYLFFESGSHSWPKSTTSKPHSPLRSIEAEAESWYQDKLVEAENYDVSNFDLLTNTIPTFLREDSNNEPYLMFVHMIAHHFDNLWIYLKATSDKYDTDNRLDFGISKDLVKDAVESFGIKLYDSNASLDNLFASFVGESYQSGSEQITETKLALSGSNEHLQPVSKDAYKKEIYKRIYHNLPYLTKTKGTQRGLRALIACYGIPDDILEIRHAPGIKVGNEDFFGPSPFISASNHGIRLDNTGSIMSGSTLSNYKSVNDLNYKYSEDSHQIHVGLNLNKDVNERLRVVTTGSFNIDEYIGDPRLKDESEYHRLNVVGEDLLRLGITWDQVVENWQDVNFNWNDELTYFRSPKGFIRLLKFFDNSIFKTIKDFIPARAVLATGLIVEPHVLNRSKAKATTVSFTNEIHTASIDVATIEAGDGDSFPYAAGQNYTTDYSASFVSPLGRIDRDVTGEEVKFTGEFSGSFIITTDGELNRRNLFKKSAQPILTFDISTFFLSDALPASCAINLVVHYEGDFYHIIAQSGGTVSQTYPLVVGATGSFDMTHDYDEHQFATVEATPVYPATFDGWYTVASGGTAVETSTTLTIYKEDEATDGNTYYARFTT